MLGTLLNYGSEAKTTRLTSGLFYKDTAGAMDETDPTKAAAAGGNLGLITRYKQPNKNASIELAGPIHADLFFQERYILDYVDMKLKFSRSKNEFCLMSEEADPKYKVITEDAIVFIRKVKVNPTVSLVIAESLRNTPAKHPIRRTEIKVFNITTGAPSFSQDNITTGAPSFSQDNIFIGQLPKRCI